MKQLCLIIFMFTTSAIYAQVDESIISGLLADKVGNFVATGPTDGNSRDDGGWKGKRSYSGKAQTMEIKLTVASSDSDFIEDFEYIVGMFSKMEEKGRIKTQLLEETDRRVFLSFHLMEEQNGNGGCYMLVKNQYLIDVSVKGGIIDLASAQKIYEAIDLSKL